MMKKNEYLNISIEKEYRKSWKYFLSLYKENIKRTIIIVLVSFFASSITISLPFITQTLTTARENKVLYIFTIMAITMILVNLIKIILDFITEYFGQYFNYELETKWREKIVEKTHRLPMSNFDNRCIGSFLSRVVYDLKDITDFAFQFLSNFIFIITVLIGGFVYIFLVTWVVGMFVLAIVFISLVIYLFFIKKIIVNRQYVKALNSRITWEIDEHVELMSEIKSFNNSNLTIQNFLNFQKDYLFATKKTYYQFALYKIIGIASNVLISSVILIIASYGLIQDKIKPEQLIGLTTAANLLVLPLITLAKVFVDIAKVTASLTRLYDWMMQEEEINLGTLKPIFNGKIEFKNVSFSYKLNNGTTHNVLKNFNLIINENDFVNFYSENNFGKTTILKLIMRFYEVDEGEILIDDIPIKDIELNYLRQSISYQSSYPRLFSSKIKAKELYSDEKKLKDILTDLKLEKTFIKKRQIDQTINSQGIQLSDSEKQLLSLARALYFNNKIILLDSLDVYLSDEQIENVKTVLNKYRNKKTIIIMSSKSDNVFNATKNEKIY